MWTYSALVLEHMLYNWINADQDTYFYSSFAFWGYINICKSLLKTIDSIIHVYFQGTILISCDLVIPVTVAVQRGEHDAERTGPLTEEDEEVMAQALLWKEEAPVVHWGGRQESLL